MGLNSVGKNFCYDFLSKNIVKILLRIWVQIRDQSKYLSECYRIEIFSFICLDWKLNFSILTNWIQAKLSGKFVWD